MVSISGVNFISLPSGVATVEDLNKSREQNTDRRHMIHARREAKGW